MKLLLILVLSTCALAYNVERNRIIGGHYASAGQFPYQISQRFKKSHICGGSIINSNTILTASHCVETVEPSFINVVVGSLTLNDGVWHDITHYVMHEDWNIATGANDIALIKIQGSIQYTWNVQPIDVDSSYINTGAESVTAGWGVTTYPSNQASYDLLYYYGSIYDLEQCKRDLYENEYPVLDTNICSYSQYGQGVCVGDSGGGLVVNGKHVGVASWVHECGEGYADVFTRTSSYVDWINRQ